LDNGNGEIWEIFFVEKKIKKIFGVKAG